MSERNPTTFPLAGHALVSKGDAHTAEGDYAFDHHLWIRTSGQGYGKCECGVFSPEVDGRTYRREWHRQHKDEVRQAQA